jgi:heat shock protein HslJ
MIADIGSQRGEEWRVHSLGGELAPRVEPPAATVYFGADQSLTGTILCNSIGGAASWTQEGGFTRLEDPMIVTTAGCRDWEGREIGGRFWTKMTFARRWERQGRGMVIHFADGSTATLKKID